jgi:putative ABC transport system permease protein
MIFNTFNISRQKLIDLLYANRKNERAPRQRLGLSAVLFLISAAMLALAYAMVLNFGIVPFGLEQTALCLLGIAGTLLFFFSLSGFFIKLTSLVKSVYFKGLNMFILKQINSKINTAYVSMALVCLMLFLGISAISVGSSIAAASLANIKDHTPYDATFEITALKGSIDFDILAALRERGADIDSIAKEYVAYTKYSTPNKLAMSEYGDAVNADMIRLSDFNRLMRMQGAPALTLNPGEYAIVADVYMDKMLKSLENLTAGEDSRLENNGMVLYAADEVVRIAYTNSFVQSTLTVVVPDAFTENTEPTVSAISMNFSNPAAEAHADLLFNYTINGKYNESCIYPYAKDSGVLVYWLTERMMAESSQGLTIVVAYLTLYIGIVFLLTCASILAIAQLSEASDNQERYRLLSKLGANTKMISKSVFRQIFIYFAAPLLLAIAHSLVAIRVMSDVVTAFGNMDVFAMSLTSGLIVIAIYGGYFLLTYRTASRLAAPLS